MKVDNSIKLGECIQKILSSSDDIINIVGEETNKIFGMKMPSKLVFPFIHYERTSLVPEYTKDVGTKFGWRDTVRYSIGCVSDDYAESVELANVVRHTIEGYRWYEKGYIWFDPIMIENVLEYEANGMFVQEIQIRIDAQPC